MGAYGSIGRLGGCAPLQQSHPTVRTSGKLAVGRYRSRRLVVTERKLGRDGIYVGMGEGRIGIGIHVYIYIYIYAYIHMICFSVARWSHISYMCGSWLCPTHPQHCNTCPLLGLLSEALPAPSTSQQWLRLRSLYATCAQRLHLFTRGVASLATLCSVVLGQRANQWAIGKSSWTCPGSTGRSSLGMATMQWGKN